jgi:hypothetical protein
MRSVKMMSLWREATEWIQKECAQTPAPTPPQEERSEPSEFIRTWEDRKPDRTGQEQRRGQDEQWRDALSPDR